MRNITVVIVVLLILGVGGFFLLGSNSPSEECTVENAVTFESTKGVATSSADISDPVIVTFNNGEVIPSCVKVSQGTEIKLY